MARPSVLNPLGYLIERQSRDSLIIRNKLFKERLAGARNLYRKDLLAHYGCVNAIEFSQEGNLLVSGGDDRRVLLWTLPQAIYGLGKPVCMDTNHISNIFCLAFDSINSKIFSGGNDDQVLIHDIRTKNLVLKLLHKKPVYGLSVNPQNDQVIATAGDDGRILLFDIRESENAEPLCLAKQKTEFHSVMFNPVNSRLLATANSEEGISLWDYRKPKEELIRYDSTANVSGISVCFNSTGSRLLALRRRLPPVLYATQSQNVICQFYHPHYYNSCTMKTCSFAGDCDEYVLSGSDDFNLYMWQVPNDESEWGKPHMVLGGHRSIVNQVRYNKNNNLIASSGVEKMVKLWSALPVGGWAGSILKDQGEAARSLYSHDDYIYLVGHSGQRISHDYSDQSILEDSRMMAFFDSLIQKEIEAWDSVTDGTVTSDSETEVHDHRPWHLLLHHSTDEYSIKKQKPNRIAQLIAQKRSKLAKMAHYKSSSSLKKANAKHKQHKQNAVAKQKSHTSSSNKTGTTSRKKTSNTANNQSALAEKDSRKRKPQFDRWTRSKKCKSRYNLRENSDISDNNIDVPSTSTGITGTSASVFRVIDQDSDDEVPANACADADNSLEENLVNILPTPLNGTHDMCLSALDNSPNVNGSIRSAPAGSAVVKRSSSHSSKNEGLTYPETYTIETCANGANNDSDSSDYECNYTTPVKRKGQDAQINTPDSGFSTGPGSSGSGYSMRSSRNHMPSSSKSINGSYNGYNSDDPDYPYAHFNKRIKKARAVRKKIGGDSDSN